MNYIIVDLEMNPVADRYKAERKICRSEIIEIGAVIMNDEFDVLGEFKTLVRPQYNDVIYKRYEEMTGISTQMVYGAPVFAAAYEMFVKWCEAYGDAYEVYAWSDNDYKQVTSEMELKHYDSEAGEGKLTKWFDFQKEYTNKLGLEKVMSLEKALNYVGIEYKGHMHDALCDSRNTAELFRIARDENSNEALRNIMDVLKPSNISSSLGELFNFGALMAKVG